jgi:hypothetical protein
MVTEVRKIVTSWVGYDSNRDVRETSGRLEMFHIFSGIHILKHIKPLGHFPICKITYIYKN